MHHTLHGIVLRTLPGSNNKITLLTENLGKIVTLIFEKNIITRLKPGTLLSLQNTRFQGNMVISNQTTIIATALSTTYSDFYWLHHLLELCYYFLPLHQPNNDIFRLLQHCFALTSINHTEHEGWEFFKKSITASLVLLFGFSPPEHLKKYLYDLKDRLSRFVDFEPQQKVKFFIKAMRTADQSLDSDIDSWIIASIETHPRIESFKTLTFMYRPPKSRIKRP